eukprot:9233202-Lingulodinium_polyedra.AAC.1
MVVGPWSFSVLRDKRQRSAGGGAREPPSSVVGAAGPCRRRCARARVICSVTACRARSSAR